MLSDWQIMILDNALWIVPTGGAIVLMAFPWVHWNSLMREEEDINASR